MGCVIAQPDRRVQPTGAKADYGEARVPPADDEFELLFAAWRDSLPDARKYLRPPQPAVAEHGQPAPVHPLPDGDGHGTDRPHLDRAPARHRGGGRDDRIVDEVNATGGDIRRIYDLFGLNVNAAIRYVATSTIPTWLNEVAPRAEPEATGPFMLGCTIQPCLYRR
jgi:hypothetical protein